MDTLSEPSAEAQLELVKLPQAAQPVVDAHHAVAASTSKAAWADYSSVFTNAKAGMEGVDKEHVKRVVYEMSKDSAHFKNEQRKQAAVDARIAKLKEAASKLTSTELAAHARAMDARVAQLEGGRDLGRTWIHVDMDAFFAACEERENAALKNVPMAVGGMGMISTANYLARKFGVRSAMPGFIGRKLCPQLVFCPPNFERYTAASAETRTVFARYDPHFAAGSLDEAYLDVTDFCGRHGLSGEQVAERIRSEVAAETRGLTCSCGVAPNRMLAKVCSDINKPNGQYVLPASREAVRAFVATLPCRKVPGIGKVTEQVLAGVLGVTTCGDLLAARAYLPALFQPASSTFLLHAALGLGATRHEDADDGSAGGASGVGRKGISCERTFRPLSGRGELEGVARQLVAHLARDMAQEGIEGNSVTLKLKTTDFRVTTHAKTLPRHVHTPEDILPPVLRLLTAQLPVSLRLMGVRMSGLRKRRGGAEAGSSPLSKFLKRAQAGGAAGEQAQEQQGIHQRQGLQQQEQQPGAQLPLDSSGPGGVQCQGGTMHGPGQRWAPHGPSPPCSPGAGLEEGGADHGLSHASSWFVDGGDEEEEELGGVAGWEDAGELDAAGVAAVYESARNGVDASPSGKHMVPLGAAGPREEIDVNGGGGCQGAAPTSEATEPQLCGGARASAAGTGQCQTSSTNATGRQQQTWACGVCTYAENRRQVLRCAVCDSLRGSTAPAADLQSGQAGQSWVGQAAAAQCTLEQPIAAPQQPARATHSRGGNGKRGRGPVGSSSRTSHAPAQAKKPRQQQAQITQLLAGTNAAGRQQQQGTAAAVDVAPARLCPRCGECIGAGAEAWQEHADLHAALDASLADA